MNIELRDGQTPISDWHRPFLFSITNSSIKQFQQAFIVWKSSFSLGQSTELAMDRFDDVSGIDNTSDIL